MEELQDNNDPAGDTGGPPGGGVQETSAGVIIL